MRWVPKLILHIISGKIFAIFFFQISHNVNIWQHCLKLTILMRNYPSNHAILDFFCNFFALHFVKAFFMIENAISSFIQPYSFICVFDTNLIDVLTKKVSECLRICILRTKFINILVSKLSFVIKHNSTEILKKWTVFDKKPTLS